MPHQLQAAVTATRTDHTLPRHIGIIPDGNRRWAKKHGLSTEAGFRAGAERIPAVLGLCAANGIDFVSFWMMSEGNLRRSAAELKAMLALTEHVVALLSEMRQWRIQLIGRLDLLPLATVDALSAAAEATADVCGPVVNLAIGYTGRDDITAAVRSLLRSPDVRSSRGDRIAETLTEEHIGRYLSTGGQPDLDLVVRTSGEVRLSGFMTWQIAESELYFSRKLWPDFGEQDFESALASYRDRDRRFGI